MTQASLPAADIPLYSHPLPQIEQWLRDQGCIQDSEELDCWHLDTAQWQAELRLDIEELSVLYTTKDDQRSIHRTFKYSLSRRDVENAVFAGP